MKILSLDGGGVRGVIPTVWLQELQSKLNKPIHEEFDLIAGTSTGSILAIGLGLGMDPGEILKMYLHKAPLIFPQGRLKRFGARISRVFKGHGLSQPKYDGVLLNKVLQDVLGEKGFGTVKTNVVVTSYDLEHMQARIFKSWRDEYKSIPAWEIARASSSAPTYLPAHKLYAMDRDMWLVDGGVVANNPAMIAVAEALRLGCKREDIVLVSLGTGQSSNVFSGKELEQWGPLQWASRIISILMDGNNDSQNYHSSMLLGDKNFRFQMTLPQDNYRLDKATKANLHELEVLARRHWNRSDNKTQVRKLLNHF